MQTVSHVLQTDSLLIRKPHYYCMENCGLCGKLLDAGSNDKINHYACLELWDEYEKNGFCGHCGIKPFTSVKHRCGECGVGIPFEDYPDPEENFSGFLSVNNINNKILTDIYSICTPVLN